MTVSVMIWGVFDINIPYKRCKKSAHNVLGFSSKWCNTEVNWNSSEWKGSLGAENGSLEREKKSRWPQ